MEVPKKTAALPPVRIDNDRAVTFKKALAYYGITNPSFFRMCVSALIDHYEKREEIRLPVGASCIRDIMMKYKTPKG